MSKPNDVPSPYRGIRRPSNSNRSSNDISDMSLHSLVLAGTSSPRGGSLLPPLLFDPSQTPPPPLTPEERRQHLLQVIDSALAIVNEIDLESLSSAEERETNRRRRNDEERQHHQQQPPQQ